MNAWALGAVALAAFAFLSRPRRRESEGVDVTITVGELSRVTAVDLVELRAAPGFFLRRDAAAAFNRATEGGGLLRVTSAFRTYEQQAKLYEAWLAGTGNLAAKPGTSLHESGRAVDARGSEAWEQAMSREGFRRTVISEPWHWEFRP